METALINRDYRSNLLLKCKSYLEQGHLVLAVTLSTFVKSDRWAHSDRTRHLWDHHFIYRVERLLPYNAPLDHDFVLECCPEGFWHYHGLLAVRACHAEHLWEHGQLNPRLVKDLRTFARAGQYRPFRVNSFLIEPIENPEAWCRYITEDPFSLIQ
jgi:hypothetical protein